MNYKYHNKAYFPISYKIYREYKINLISKVWIVSTCAPIGSLRTIHNPIITVDFYEANNR